MLHFLKIPICIFAWNNISPHWPHWLKIYGLSGVDFLIYRCNEHLTKYAPSGLSFGLRVCETKLIIKEIYPRSNVDEEMS